MTQIRHVTLPAYPVGSLPDPQPEMDVQIVSVAPNGARTLLRSDGKQWVPQAGTGNMLAENNLGDLTNPASARTSLGLDAGAVAPKATIPQAVSGTDNTSFMTPAAVAAAIAAALGAVVVPPAPPPPSGNAYADNYVATGYVN